MPEIKHNFMKGKMNKDLDERLVPNGEYRDALNIQVSTSEGSDVGAVQNILGNSLLTGQNFIPINSVCVGSIADEKNDKLYYFITQKQLLLNGGFNDNGRGWKNQVDGNYTGSQWTFSNNQAVATFQEAGTMYASAPGVVDGNNYTITYDIVVASPLGQLILANHTTNASSLNSGGNNNVDLVGEKVAGTYTVEWEQGPSASRQNNIWLYTNNAYRGTIDNVSVFESSRARSLIVEYDSAANTITPVLVDMTGDTLKFDENNIITGINIIDDLLLWTDNVNEPKKINIPRCKAGTDTSGLVHTNLIVKEFPEGPIKEEHITVIKKNPSKAPEVKPVTVLPSYVSGDMKSYPYFYPPGPNKDGVKNAIVDEGHEMWISIPNSNNGEKPKIIAGDVIKVYLGPGAPSTDEDGNAEQPIAMLLVKEVASNPDQSFISNQIQNDFGNQSALIASGGELAFKVAVTSLAEHTPFPNMVFPKYYFELAQQGKGIFERKLPRFAYRYKYEDGEYSSVGPYSEVVFIPGKFNYHPTEAYNKGMVNNLKRLELHGFVTADTPRDVVQIDLLYKNEFSPSVFLIKTIDKNEPAWLISDSEYPDAETGSYTITTENVYAQLPSNQLIRPWDNVPKKALAQEVTGNRVVYGNYLQNYDLGLDVDGNAIVPNLSANLDSRRYSSEEGGARKSIKSQRTYNFGIVYGDDYGRETPVFTNDKANQLITKASSSSANAISINVNSDPPAWADYYKIFVKETSNEYYNLAMGRMYNAEDGNVWLSFPSIDRNKVDEDTYLILKKGSETNTSPVAGEAKYKIVAIENEAPDYIKTEYEVICETVNSSNWSSYIFGGSPVVSGFTAPAKLPTPGSQSFTIDAAYWVADNSAAAGPTKNLGLPDLLEIYDKSDDDLYVSFSNIDKRDGVSFSESPKKMSKKYKVSEITLPDSMLGLSVDGNDMYNVIISEIIPSSDAWYTEYVSSGISGATLSGKSLAVHFYRKIVENKPEFDGRFFVKIYEDDTIRQFLTVSDLTNSGGWKVDAQTALYYVADASPTNGITNGTTGDPNASSTTPFTSMTQAHWARNLGGSSGSRWFVDAASFAGLQPLDQLDPRKSEFVHESQNLCDVSNDVYYYEYDPNITTDGIFIHFGGANTVVVNAAPIIGQSYAANLIKFPMSTQANPSFASAFQHGLAFKPDPYNTEQPAYPIPSGSDFDRATSILNYTKYFQAPTGEPKIYLNESFLKSTLRSFGTKQSLGASNAFLRGAHTGSYSTDPAVLGDLSGNGGYDASPAVVSNYLHLSYGGVGPYDPTDRTNEGITWEHNYKKEFWDNYGWDKNWWVGKDGNSSDLFSGENPSNDSEINIVKRLKPNSLFRLGGNENIYKIKSVTKRRLYNHTGAMEDTVDSLNELEEFMVDPNSIRNVQYGYQNGQYYEYGGSTFNTTNLIAPSEIRGEVIADNATAGIDFYYQDTSVAAQHRRMVRSDNCRLSYLIKYETLNSTDNNNLAGAVAKDFHDNPQFDTSLMGVDRFGVLEFVSEYTSTKITPLTDNPAIFETEPKEDVGLDIYYEATGKIPTNASSPNTKIQNLIHIGAALVITPATSVYSGDGTFVTDIVYDVALGNWVVTTSSPVREQDLRNKDLRFYNNDGTYTAASWVDPNPPLPNTNPPINPTGGTGLNTSANQGYYQGPPLQAQSYGNPNVGINQIEIIIHPNAIGLSWFNCWSFGNGVESNRIGDTYNKPFITNGVKASTTLLDSYEEEHRKYGLIYSGIYNSTSGVNDLNQFIAAEKITKDVNPIYGSIQKLHSRSSADGDLIALCEDRVLKILAEKDALYNADGNPQLIANNNVLGQTIPFSGEFGISTNPESFASESYRVYFTDKIRGAVMRLSKDGLTPISNFGMKDWFRDNLKLSSKLIGSYDDKKEEYNITLTDRKTLGEELFKDPKITSAAEYVRFDLSADYSGKGVLLTSTGDGTGSRFQYWAQRGFQLDDGVTYELNVEFSDIDNGGKSLLGDNVIKFFMHGDNANGGNTSYYLPAIRGVRSAGRYTETFTFNKASNNSDSSTEFKVELFRGDEVDKKIRVKYVSLKPVISDPTTVSFKENVKGWVSFKSFVPENGVSMASNYYTMLGGKLYEHHVEDVNRNNFYEVGYNSSVNVLLNDSPGSIKSFHTLAYEGSQSKIDIFSTDSTTGLSDAQPYNLTLKNGWFVSSIETNKQVGSVREFIEKEGKWFNYIKGSNILHGDGGSILANPINGVSSFDHANFAIQGIGMANNVIITSVTGCTDASASNYDPTATVDDGSCIPVVSGCTNAGYKEYDSTANTDDGTCLTICQFGCSDPIAANYFPGTTCDGSGYSVSEIKQAINTLDLNGIVTNSGDFTGCCYVFGCTDASATNYDSTACIDDGSCTY